MAAAVLLMQGIPNAMKTGVAAPCIFPHYAWVERYRLGMVIWAWVEFVQAFFQEKL